jgi:hypothetical protein
LLTNPVVILFAAVPLVVVGTIHALAFRALRGRKDLPSKAARWALIPSWLSLLGWTLYVLHAIAVSQQSTAVFGIIAIPFVGGPLALFGFAVAWAASVVALSLRMPNRHEPLNWWAVTLACLILALAGACAAFSTYGTLLQRRAREERSADALRALRAHWWGRHDIDVVDAVARNPHTPSDVLTELASHPDDTIRSAVARNPSTPAATLKRLYAEPENRLSLSLNPGAPPALLRRLAHDRDHLVRRNLLFNAQVSLAILETLAHDPAVGTVATAVLRRRREGAMWSIVVPPYTWRWLRPFSRVLDDRAPLEEWSETPYRFPTQPECEAMHAELVRRELNPRRIAAIQRSGRTGSDYQPFDLFSRGRCALR